MPQASKRSNGYRSFLTCNDPKGVVECGTIKVSKNSSQKRVSNNEDQRKQTSLSHLGEKEMGFGGEVHNPSSLQLLQVSRGAEKLNNVIDSWSTRLSHDVQPKDMAEELLKEALDLRQSLNVLSKLQEASDRLSGLARKQAEGEGRRTSFEEVKKVIRDTVVRQHDCEKMDSSDMPSTSSSQSTMVASSNFPSSESSVSSTASQKKGKRSNLIARLMGLESMPSSPRRQIGHEKFLIQKKDVFDVDLPMSTSPLTDRSVGRRQNTLDEILETMKFKGLLKRNSLNGISSRSDDKPPIVVIKPRRVSSESMEDAVMPASHADVGLDELLMKLRSKRELRRKTEERLVSHSSGRFRGVQNDHLVGGAHSKEDQVRGESTRVKDKGNISFVKKVASVNMHHKPLRKQINEVKADEVQQAIASRKKGVKSGNEVHLTKLAASKMQRPKDGTTVKKNPNSKQQAMNSRPVLQCDGGKTSASSGNSSSVRQGNEKVPVKKMPVKKLPSNDDQEGCRDAKDVIHGFHENKTVLSATETLVKEQVSTNKIDSCRASLKDHQFDNQSSLCEIVIPSHEEPGVANYSQSSFHETALLDIANNVEDTSDKQEDSHSTFSGISLPIPEDGGVATHCSSLEERAMQDRHKLQIADHHEKEKDYVRESTSSALRNRDDHLTAKEYLTATAKLRALLLSSLSFTNRAEELFYLNTTQNLVDREPEVANARLLVDCATELLELRSSQYGQAHTPLLQSYRTMSKNYIYLDQLLEEICEGVEALRCCSEPSQEALSNDSLQSLLDRDLRYAGMASGTWDAGWRNEFSVHEVEDIISEVDKLVLAGLIEEIVEDFVV